MTTGLAFQGWLLNAPYYPRGRANGAVRALAALQDAKKWSAMERLYSNNACHFFMACRTERPSYRIDWSASASLDYTPVFRMRCGLEGSILHRPGRRMLLTAEQLPLVQLIDGRASIREIAARAAATGAPQIGDPAAFARALFQSLWQLDFVAMALSAVG